MRFKGGLQSHIFSYSKLQLKILSSHNTHSYQTTFIFNFCIKNDLMPQSISKSPVEAALYFYVLALYLYVLAHL